jgi:uncharacterized protein
MPDRQAPVTDHALAFGCAGERLHGVLSVPEAPSPTGVLVIVGGPQTRVGSHRQFVLLARRLAAAGHAVLRFDVRGMGDSGGPLPQFERSAPDIGAAIELLMQRVPALRRVVLWGLCDGASAALLYLHERRDTRVAGLCLVNPWVRSAQSQAQTQLKHYYRDRLKQRAFWLKLLSGRVAWAAARGLFANLRAARAGSAAAAGPATYQQRMAAACAAFEGALLVLLSERDYTAREFETALAHDDWAASRPRLRLEHVAAADHTFSSTAAREAMELVTLDWLVKV